MKRTLTIYIISVHLKLLKILEPQKHNKTKK